MKKCGPSCVLFTKSHTLVWLTAPPFESKIFHIDVPINTQNEDIPNILEEYGLKESECNYIVTEYPCKIINLTYEDKIVNKEDKI